MSRLRGIDDGLAPTPWNWTASTPTFPSTGGMRINLSANGAQYPAAGQHPSSENQRCEVEPAPAKQWEEGQAGYFRLDVELLAGFPTQAQTWQLLMQWHGNDQQSPPVSLQVWRGQFIVQFHGQGSKPTGYLPLGPATIGAHRIVVGLMFSQDPAKALVSGKLNGKTTVPTQRPPSATLNNNYNYLKFGIYRDIQIRDASSLIVHLVAIGPTVESVENA